MNLPLGKGVVVPVCGTSVEHPSGTVEGRPLRNKKLRTQPNLRPQLVWAEEVTMAFAWL